MKQPECKTCPLLPSSEVRSWREMLLEKLPPSKRPRIRVPRKSMKLITKSAVTNTTNNY